MNSATSAVRLVLSVAIALIAAFSANNVFAQANKPATAGVTAGKKTNILIIWGDDKEA